MIPHRKHRIRARAADLLLTVLFVVVSVGLSAGVLLAEPESAHALGISAENLATAENSEGYSFWVIPKRGLGGDTAVVLRNGRVVYRWPLVGPAPPVPEGQPDKKPHWYPIRDLTGNGFGTVHIQDLTSRSTTQHVILDLGPDGITELFNDSLHFTERLTWEDTDSDGVREPISSVGPLIPGAPATLHSPAIREEMLRHPKAQDKQ